MKEYKVKKEDLKGEIKDFPIEIVQRMIDYQVEQGNEADVKVFQRKNYSASYLGGFSWDNTVEGFDFWDDVINDKEFYVFFNKYPKDGKLDTEHPKENLHTETSNEPHLIYSYEDYKNSKKDRCLSSKMDSLSEKTTRLMALSLNFNKTKEEEEEYNTSSKEIVNDGKNRNFTTLTHEITDLYFELKNIHDDDIRHEKYELIGRKQCEIEIIKEEFKNK